MGRLMVFRYVNSIEEIGELREGEFISPEFDVPGIVRGPATPEPEPAASLSMARHPRRDAGATAIASPDNPLQMVSRNIEIQKLSRQGLSNRHIGRRFGISGARVKQILDAGGGSTAPVAADPRRLKRRRWSAKAHKRAALRRQSRQKATPELMEEMLALREQGYMIKELCEAYHYSSAQVDRLLKRAAAARSAVATEVAT